MGADYSQLPADLPVPEDDGAADHLAGMAVPELRLPSTRGGAVDLAEAGRTASSPTSTRAPARRASRCQPAGTTSPVPAAARRRAAPTATASPSSPRSARRVIGISAQSPEEQREFAEREHIPFPLLSDSGLARRELRLPTFEADGMTLYKRLTLIAEAGRIVKVFYPVFPPDRNAAEVLAWLRRRS